jgi:hypothetical protein
MGVTDATIFINNAHQRHAAKFEEVDLLAIEDRDAVFGIGNTDERDVFVAPVLLKGGIGVWANGEDDRLASLKFFVIVSQARQRRAAIGSHEAAQEIEQNRLAAKIGEADATTVEVINFEFGGRFARGDEFHFKSAFTFFQILSNISTVSLPVNVFCWLGW